MVVIVFILILTCKNFESYIMNTLNTIYLDIINEEAYSFYRKIISIFGDKTSQKILDFPFLVEMSQY